MIWTEPLVRPQEWRNSWSAHTWIQCKNVWTRRSRLRTFLPFFERADICSENVKCSKMLETVFGCLHRITRLQIVYFHEPDCDSTSQETVSWLAGVEGPGCIHVMVWNYRVWILQIVTSLCFSILIMIHLLTSSRIIPVYYNLDVIWIVLPITYW